MDQVPKGPVVGSPRAKDPEQIVLQVRKHLFGLFVLYFQTAVGIVAALALVVFLVPSLVNKSDQAAALAWVSLITLILIVIMGIVLVIATMIYRRSFLVVTTTNITQVQQKGLFNRKISKLSLGDVEDVSAEQKGVFASIFNFGTLIVETAGEQANFHFDYCPTPNKIAKEVSIVEQGYNTVSNPDS